MGKDALYQITVTEQQLQMIADACELMGRVSIGQWGRFIDYLPVKSSAPTLALEKALLPTMAKYLTDNRHENAPAINGYNSSYGVRSDFSSKNADMLFDLNEVIRHRLAWDRNPKGGNTRNFDAPFHWDKHVPLARIVRVNVDPIPTTTNA